MPLFLSEKDAARLRLATEGGKPPEPRTPPRGSKTTRKPAEARTARSARSDDISDDEWAGTGPKGRYPVPLQYQLWERGWLCCQETPALLHYARHRRTGQRVGPAASRKALLALLEGL